MTQLELAGQAYTYPPGQYRFRHQTKPDIEFEGRVHEHRGTLYVRAILRPADPLAASLDEQPGLPLDRLVGRYEITPID